MISKEVIGWSSIALLVVLAVSAWPTDKHKTHAATETPTCRTDWKICTDNSDLVNHWKDWDDVRWACKKAANDKAKYGAGPEWPWLFFGTFLKGDDYPKDGLVTAIENDAKFTNGFNTKVRSKVGCLYDLNTSTVLYVEVTER